MFLFILLFTSTFLVQAGVITFQGDEIRYGNLGILDNIQNISLQNDSLFIIDEENGFLKAYFNVPDGEVLIPSIINITFPDTFNSNTSTGFLGDVDNFDNQNAFSRFKETNLHNGTNASAGFIGVNNIGRSISLGIGSENFEFLNISLPNVGVLRLKAPSNMIFANDFLTSWLWATDLNNGSDFTNPFTSMILSPKGNLNISGNFTVNASVTFPHIESAATQANAVRMFCKSDDNCYLQLSNGDTRRLLDVPGGPTTLIFDELVTFQAGINITNESSIFMPNFSEGSVLFMGSNNEIREDVNNFFWNETENRMGIGTQISGHPLHIFDPQTIMAKFESSNAGPVGIQVSSGVMGGDAYIRFTEGEENEDWIIGLDDTANRFFIENSITPTDNSPFVILADGFVGINTSNPAYLLHVSGGDIEIDPNYTIGNQDAFDSNFPVGFIDFGIKKDGLNIGFAGMRVDEVLQNGGDPQLYGTLRFFTDTPGIDFSTERMTILGTGEVGIGNANPSYKLEVNGNVNLDETLFVNSTSGSVGIGTVAPSQKLEVSGGNIEIDPSFTIGSLDGFILGGSPGFIDYGIKKSGFENRFSGMKVDEIDVGGDLYGTLRFFTDAEGIDFSTERMTILGTGEVGIGTNTPNGTLHVYTAGSGVVTADIDADDLIIENDGDGGISILGPQSLYQQIVFGSPADNRGAVVRWTHDSGDFELGSARPGGETAFMSGDFVEVARFDSGGNLGIGTSGPLAKLDVRGDFVVDGGDFFVDTNSGFVGVGTLTPSSKLEVSGILTVSAGSARIELEDTAVSGSEWWILPSTGGNTDLFRIYDVGAAQDRLVIDGIGNVGIDQPIPLATLHIGDRDTGPSDTFIRLSTGNGIQNRQWELGTIYGDTNVSGDNYDFLIRDLGGGGATKFLIEFDTGNVGIGTITPDSKLHVQGNLLINGSGGEIRLSSTDGSIEITRLAGIPFIDFKNVPNEDFDFRIQQKGVENLNFESSSRSSILFLDGLGNVGIGTQTPVGKLNVIGDLNVTGTLTAASIIDTGTIIAETIFDDTIFAQLSSFVDQIPIGTDPEVITYNTQDDINRITHSISVNPGEITIDVGGTYFVSPQPQVGKDSGGTKVDFDMFLQVDRNGTFINEPNSNIKLTIKDADVTDVIVSAFTIQLDAGEKIRMMQRTSNAGVGMGLKNTNITGSVPRTPSIIFTMYRIGG